MSPWTLKPTALERSLGRLLRGPDGHDGDGGSGSDAGDGGDANAASSGGGDNGADAGADKAVDDNDASLLGDAGTKAGDGDGGKDADADKSADGDGKGEADAKAEGPPETYDLKVTIKAEDGTETPVEIDQGLLSEATPTLKELGLTNEQANKVAALVPSIQQRLIQQQADNFAAMKADWAKEVQDDPELGGAKWAETEALAAKALDTFGAPSVKDKDGNETNPFRKLLNDTGLGNQPDMIRMFRSIGEKLGEGDFVRGEAGAKQKPDRVRELYPNDPPKEVKA